MSAKVLEMNPEKLNVADVKEITGTDVIFEVNETSKRLFDATEQRKIQKEREELRLKNELKECTFAPKINHSRKSKGSKRSSNMTAGERLYNKAKESRLLKEKLKQKRREEEKLEMTFKPKILQKNMKHDPKVFDRLSKSHKQERLRELQKLKEKKELEGCTFAPQLSKKSLHYDKRHSNGGSVDQSRSYSSLSRSDSTVFERLSRDNSLRLMKQEELKKKKLEEELKGCTFDARKTIDNVRKEQYERQVKLQTERLEIQVNLKGKIPAPKSSLEVGPSCFQQAMNLVRFSAKTLSTSPKYEQIRDQANEENCPAVQNRA